MEKEQGLYHERGIVRMKRKLWIIAMAAMMVIALMAGCSAQQSGADRNDAMPAATQAPSAEEGKAGDDGGSTVIDPGNAAQSGKKIIYNADIVMEAEDAQATADKIADKAVELGGYLADSQIYVDRRDAQSYITVRIAPEKLKEFTTYIGTLGKGISKNVSSQDVTAQYTDMESALRNAQAQEAQLLKIMEQAVKVEDILAVRRELNAVQKEIEEYKGQLRLYDNQVGFATVRVYIRQPAPPAVVVEKDPDKGVEFWGFAAVWQKITRGLSDSFNWTLNAFSGLVIALSYAAVPLLLIAIVVLAIIFIIRSVSRKGKKQAK